jgi:hypothetical protein
MSTSQRFTIVRGEDSTDYAPNPVHRDRTQGKSQWTVTLPEEVAIFTRTYVSFWVQANEGWGLYYNNGVIAYLGKARNHLTKVFLAKFVSDQNLWHGYPVDYQQSEKDIPPTSITNLWLQDGILPAPTLRKIIKRQPCKL